MSVGFSYFIFIIMWGITSALVKASFLHCRLCTKTSYGNTLIEKTLSLTEHINHERGQDGILVRQSMICTLYTILLTDTIMSIQSQKTVVLSDFDSKLSDPIIDGFICMVFMRQRFFNQVYAATEQAGKPNAFASFLLGTEIYKFH